MYRGDLFTTCFDPKGPSLGNTYIKTTNKSYWVISGLYVNEIQFLQLSSSESYSNETLKTHANNSQ